MSDSELDSIFREAAEGYKAPNDPSAWKGMSARLDQEAVGTTGSSFWNWKTISTVAVVATVSVVSTWYVLTNGKDKSIKSPEIAQNNTVDEKKLPADQPVHTPEAGTGTTTLTPGPVTPASTAREIQSGRNSGRKHERTPGAIASNDVEKPGGRERTVTSASERNESQPTPKIAGQQDVPDDEIKVAPVAETDQSPVQQHQPENGIAERKSSIHPEMQVTADSTILQQEELPVTSDEGAAKENEEKPEEEKKNFDHAISIKLAVAPDFSSINFFSPDKPGLNYGALIGYSFNKRWSVYTGVISSRKIYTSKDVESSYTSSAGYPYDINELEGDCRVLDIPVNIYYTFFPERSFSIKAGIGISSYLMLSEEYVYHVDNPYGPDTYDQSISHENNEWFKVMNVSVILQKRLNDRFYLEFEPFLKAPLAGVGEGEVSLVSLGAFFNLRYDLPITIRKRK